MAFLKKNKLFLNPLILITVILFFIIFFFNQSGVKADPVNSCPDLTNLGYCEDTANNAYSYYCGIKFNDAENVTVKFLSDNFKIDRDGNVIFNYYDENIIPGEYLNLSYSEFVIDGTNDLIISATDTVLVNGASSIIPNDTNISSRTKLSQDFEIKRNDGTRVAFFDDSDGNLYTLGKLIKNGDEIAGDNDFFNAYDAGAEESRPHYCKKYGEILTLSYGCFIGSVDKLPGEKETANSCSHCDPDSNLRDWSETATGGTCTLPNSSTGTCASGTCVCDNNPDCDDTEFCNGSGLCISGSCSQDGNPCIATNQYCSEGSDACYGCINDSACSSPTPACRTSDYTCVQCTSTNLTQCNDGLVCTTEGCSSNSCTNTLNAGYCLIGGVCYANGAVNPGNQCQKCDTSVSTGAWSNKDATVSCNADSSGCTVNDTCNGLGACVAGSAPNCNDSNVCTDDSCTSTGINTYSCTNTNNTVSCNDSNSCTYTDTCSGGSCAGTAYSCNDSNVCTDDSCDGDGTCTNTNNTVSCNDSNSCTVGDVCSGGSCAGTMNYCDIGSCIPCIIY
ncbi:MAG: hypothetical protein ABIE43_04600 [Patescibacteria group bacterium]